MSGDISNNTYDAIVVREHGDPSVLKLEKKEVPALQPSQVSIEDSRHKTPAPNLIKTSNVRS